MALTPEVSRPLWTGGPSVSPVGFGCYRVDQRHDPHREALSHALASGVSLVDTSTNYADGWSERLVGSAVAEVVASGRPAPVVVTKAGYVQGSNMAEAHQRLSEGHPWPEVVAYAPDCWHCISPAFLEDQLTASLGRLGTKSVDVLLLHNPEYFLTDAAHRGVPTGEAREAFYDRVARALAHLQVEVARGRVGAYGISSNTFVVPRERADFVDLTRVLPLAGPGFRVIQLPMNPVELGAREPIHTEDGRSVLDVAREAGLGVLVNRPFNAFGPRGLVRFAGIDWSQPAYRPAARGGLAEAERMEAERRRELLAHMDEVFGPLPQETVSHRTLAGLLATPGVTSVLVGMRSREYVDDVLAAFPQAGRERVDSPERAV